MSVAALAVCGGLAAVGMYGAYFALGGRYEADEDPAPYPHRDPAEVDTEPWPTPR